MASKSKQELEDRIFDLLADHTTFDIAQKLDMPYDEAYDVIEKVILERGTPRLAAARRAIDRLAVLEKRIIR